MLIDDATLYKIRWLIALIFGCGASGMAALTLAFIRDRDPAFFLSSPLVGLCVIVTAYALSAQPPMEKLDA